MSLRVLASVFLLALVFNSASGEHDLDHKQPQPLRNGCRGTIPPVAAAATVVTVAGLWNGGNCDSLYLDQFFPAIVIAGLPRRTLLQEGDASPIPS
jgi:hypothetical protein